MKLFDFRKIQTKDEYIQEYIIIPKDTNYVIKYYLSDEYISDYFWEKKEFWFYIKENNNYNFFARNNILVPKIISNWIVKIWKYEFKYIKFENIRINNIKVKNFNQIDINKFVKFIYKLNNIKPWYVYGSLHASDVYLTNDWDIGIFDLIDYYKWYIETDIARICFGYNLELKYIKKFLLLYWYEHINFSRLLSEIYSLLDLHEVNNTDFIKLVYYIKKIHTNN